MTQSLHGSVVGFVDPGTDGEHQNHLRPAAAGGVARFIHLVLLSSALLPPPAGADSPPTDSASGVSADKEQIEEVIVTANRQEERQQDVPITVTAVRGEALREQGVMNPEQLAKISPSLTTQNGAANPQGSNFSIRGVGTSSFQRSIEASVATVIDDVTLIRPEMGLINFVDISQVEVLNGPQGMLFGKNASAGLIHVKTNNPVIGETSERIFSEYGQLNTGNNTSLFQLQSITNIGLSDNSALRVNLFGQDNGSVNDNVVANPHLDDGLRELGGSAKLLLHSTDRLKFLFAGDYLQSEGQGGGMSAFRSVAPGSPDEGLLASVGVTPSTENTKSAYNGPTKFDYMVGGGQFNIDYEISDDLTLTNIAAYRKADIDQMFDADIGPATLIESYRETHGFEQLSEELRLASRPGERFGYQVGLYFLTAQITQRSLLAANLGSTPPPGFDWVLATDAQYQQDLDSYAMFGQASYQFADSWKFIAGARVTYDDVKMTYDAKPNGGLLQLIPVAPKTTDSTSNTNLSGRATLQYDIDPDRMLYATAAQGYKGPGYSQFSVTVVDPEIPTHFEIGGKAELLDRRLSLNLALFYTKFKDFQSQAVDFSTFTIVVKNAGELLTKGVDFQFAAVPVTGLTISGGVSYTDATFQEYKNDLCYTGQPDCVNGVTDSSGNRLPNAPEWKGLLDARYEHSIADNLSLGLGAAVSSQSSMNFSSNENPASSQPGYTTVDLDASLGSDSGRWKVRVFCRNCTDQRFVGTVQQHPLFTGDYVQNWGYGAFRNIGAAVDLKF